MIASLAPGTQSIPPPAGSRTTKCPEPIIDDVACLPYQGCGWPDSALGLDLPEAVISTLTSDQDEVASASRHSISAGSAINIPVAFEGAATAAIVVLARDDGVTAMVGRHAPDTAA